MAAGRQGTGTCGRHVTGRQCWTRQLGQEAAAGSPMPGLLGNDEFQTCCFVDESEVRSSWLSTSISTYVQVERDLLFLMWFLYLRKFTLAAASSQPALVSLPSPKTASRMVGTHS